MVVLSTVHPFLNPLWSPRGRGVLQCRRSRPQGWPRRSGTSQQWRPRLRPSRQSGGVGAQTATVAAAEHAAVRGASRYDAGRDGLLMTRHPAIETPATATNGSTRCAAAGAIAPILVIASNHIVPIQTG